VRQHLQHDAAGLSAWGFLFGHLPHFLPNAPPAPSSYHPLFFPCPPSPPLFLPPHTCSTKHALPLLPHTYSWCGPHTLGRAAFRLNHNSNHTNLGTSELSIAQQLSWPRRRTLMLHQRLICGPGRTLTAAARFPLPPTSEATCASSNLLSFGTVVPLHEKSQHAPLRMFGRRPRRQHVHLPSSCLFRSPAAAQHTSAPAAAEHVSAAVVSRWILSPWRQGLHHVY